MPAPTLCWSCGNDQLVALTLVNGVNAMRISLFCKSCGVRCSGHN